MTDFYEQHLIDPMKKIVTLYYQEANNTEDNITKDSKAAIMIQARFRMFKNYKFYKLVRKGVILMQRIVRGIIVRGQIKKLRVIRNNLQNNSYFSTQATLIQKMFRGFYQRKYVHDFSARKKYLEYLKDRNTQFHELLKKNELKEKEEEQIRNEKVARLEFAKLTKNLHHLSSTITMPGVYNPPFGSKPLAFSIDIETHLKSSFKQSFQSKSYSRLRLPKVESTKIFKASKHF